MKAGLMRISFALTLALLATPAVAQTHLAVCDAKHKRIMLYDATTGALINKDFIINMGTTFSLDRPREVLAGPGAGDGQDNRDPRYGAGRGTALDDSDSKNIPRCSARWDGLSRLADPRA